MNKIDIEELYWIDLAELLNKPDELNEIFEYIKDYNSRSIQELAQILRLYSNPSGVFTKEFAEIIRNVYRYNKIKFIKALNLIKDESINLVYVFRSKEVFEDVDKEVFEILNSNRLSEEEIDTTDTFFKMYKTICAT
ncbi:hypothetical protein [Tissierella sp.]|uniref:hypothetical protein n=1 Tax=Tissierella sp. TaxID=41274 RepID=UPI0028B0E018|nr:hypothetical protein [Tissierella sp.]